MLPIEVVKNCQASAFKCSRAWDTLDVDPTNPEQRHCNQCMKTVHLCTTDQELLKHVKAGHCVAIAWPRPGLEDPHITPSFIGKVSPDYFEERNREEFERYLKHLGKSQNKGGKD